MSSEDTLLMAIVRYAVCVCTCMLATTKCMKTLLVTVFYYWLCTFLGN